MNIFKLMVPIVVVGVAGCAQLGPTPEQMKAMEGLSASLCVKSPGWNGSSVEVHYSSFGGKSVGTAGGGGKVTCGASMVEFQNEGRLPHVITPAPATVTTITTVPTK